MATVSSRPIFQMRLGLGPSFEIGWLFGDEGTASDGYYSLSYAVAWRPDLSLKDSKYYLPGEVQGEYSEFSFRFNGVLFLFEDHGTKIRLALQPPLTIHDIRGFPFLQVLPYVGSKFSVLDYYGKEEFRAFVPLVPLDLIEMDRLYLEKRITFVGVTTGFGRHAR